MRAASGFALPLACLSGSKVNSLYGWAMVLCSEESSLKYKYSPDRQIWAASFGPSCTVGILGLTRDFPASSTFIRKVFLFFLSSVPFLILLVLLWMSCSHFCHLLWIWTAVVSRNGLFREVFSQWRISSWRAGHLMVAGGVSLDYFLFFLKLTGLHHYRIPLCFIQYWISENRFSLKITKWKVFLLRFGDAEPHLLEQIKGNSIKTSKTCLVGTLKFGMMCEPKNPQNLMSFVGRTSMQGMSLKLMFRKARRSQTVQNLSGLWNL